jgi:RNA polymerase sigma factor (sigma-70 family)
MASLVQKDTDQLVINPLDYHNLACKIARRFMRYGCEYDDLYQEAMMEIIRCSRSYRPELGVRFLTYAFKCCQGRMKNALSHMYMIKLPTNLVGLAIRAKRGRVRVDYLTSQRQNELACAVAAMRPMLRDNRGKRNLFLSRIVQTSTERLHQQSLFELETVEFSISELLDFIGSRRAYARIMSVERIEYYQRVVILRYGLDSSYGWMTLEAISNEFMTTRENIRQILLKALRDIRFGIAIDFGSHFIQAPTGRKSGFIKADNEELALKFKRVVLV